MHLDVQKETWTRIFTAASVAILKNWENLEKINNSWHIQNKALHLLNQNGFKNELNRFLKIS